jgi:hypothetical protein
MESALRHSQFICIELLIALGVFGIFFLALLFHPTVYWLIAGTLNAIHFILVIRYSRTYFKFLLIVSFLVPIIYLIYPFYLEMNTNYPRYTFVPLIYYFLGASLLVIHLIFNRRWQRS